MKNFLKRGLLFILLTIPLLLLTSCKSSTAEIPSTPIPTPKPGEGQLIGIALNNDGEPLQNIPIRLAQVYRENEQGAFVLDTSHSPSSISSSKGEFVLLGIPPAEYLLVVGKPEDNNYIIYQDKDGKPITYTIKGGESLNIGKIQVDFKP